SWDASITSVGRKIHTANSWIRIKDRKSFVQVANCSASSSYIRPGQKVALADLLEYSSQNKDSANEYQSESPMPKQKGLDKDIEETNRDNGAEDRGLFSFSLANDMLSAEGFPIRGTSEAKDCLVPLQDFTDSRKSVIVTVKNNEKFSKNPTQNLIEPSAENLQTCHTRNTHIHTNLNSYTKSIHHVKPTTPSTDPKFLEQLDFTGADLDDRQKQQLRGLLSKFEECFSDTPGRTDILKHHIDTGDSRPIKLRPYRVSPPLKRIISEEISQMLKQGIIEQANSPYAAPVTLQSKRDGTLRFCIDFRQLNSVTVRDVYPLPRIDDTLDQLQNAKYFTSLDLKSGFWQVELDDQ
ncbi:unnamed protein product, partial [Didymodactylos carnosus]